MQIVINIDDEKYNVIKSEELYNTFPIEMKEWGLEAIRKGTPIPKGHGRLGDLDALETEMVNGIKAGLMIEGYENYSNINDVDDCLECVKYADAIIEADRSEES